LPNIPPNVFVNIYSAECHPECHAMDSPPFVGARNRINKILWMIYSLVHETLVR